MKQIKVKPVKVPLRKAILVARRWNPDEMHCTSAWDINGANMDEIIHKLDDKQYCAKFG